MAAVALSCAGVLPGQIPLNPSPSRTVGHARLPLSTGNPNLVEGRELFSPQGIAVDTSASPPILYVSDTGNNRVMVWKNAAGFANGAQADLIIGQQDPYTTFAYGPGTTFATGLNSPTGLAVHDGNLYVVDTGNNRILRFPKPAAQTDQFPDMVIGQVNFNSRTANQGGTPTAKTLALASGSTVYRANVAFDRSGNMWVTDPGNSRVLRYPAADVSQGTSAPAADLVIGQVDFSTVAATLAANATNQQLKDRLQVPAGIAFDSDGRLFVTDALSRVLVYAPPFATAMAARRVLGVVISTTGLTQSTIDRTAMLSPEGVFMVTGNRPAVVDTLSSRILVFDPFDQWPAEAATSISPMARNVVGQSNDFGVRLANGGQPAPSASTLSGPVAAAMAGGEMYVADSSNNRVVVLPESGSFFAPAVRVLGQDQYTYNSPNLIEGREFQFTQRVSSGSYADAGLAVDTRSDPPRLYVADTYNNRVLAYRDLRKLRPGDRADIVIGQPDMFTGQCNYPSNSIDKATQNSLCGPAGLAVDPQGNLWVADGGNGRVLRFPDPFANPSTMPQADLVIGQVNFTTRITDPTARTMASPYGLAFAGENGLLVSDQTHNRVLFFPMTAGEFTSGMAATKVYGQPSFTTALQSTSGSAEDNRMWSPHHIATDTDARIYVADTRNSRVMIFDQVGNTPAANARAVLALSSLASVRGVWVSPETGEIWASDTTKGHLLRYPRFDRLSFANFQSDATIAVGSVPLAVAQDQYGDLFLADGSSRVAIHYPGMAAINGAHFLTGRALAPGMVASVFPLGSQLASETKAFSGSSLPTELADTQVLVDDTPAPLYFVSPGQINLCVPANAPTSGTAEFQVVRKSTGQVLASGPVQMNVAAPALFTANATGNGQVMALNQDYSVNSSANPAARGSIISLYGTGQGVVAGAPADGEAPQGPVHTADLPRVIVGTCFVDDCGESGQMVQYSGLAPGLVGVWQVNVKIPMATAPGGSVPIALLYKNIASTGGTPARVSTTIAVKQ